MSIPYLKELQVAEQAVQRAAILTKKVLASVSTQEIEKDDKSPVTIADFGGQSLIIATLREAFPESTFVGEESSKVLREDEGLREQVWELVSDAPLEGFPDLYTPATPEEMMDLIDLGTAGEGTQSPGYVWVMDPVDGTATYLKNQQYVIALSLLIDGKEVLSVLGCPNLLFDNGTMSETLVDTEGYGYRMVAVQGHGAFMRKVTGPEDAEFSYPEDLPEAPSQPDDSPVQRLKVSYWNTSTPPRFANWNDPMSIDVERTQKVAGTVNGNWLHATLWSSQLRYLAVATGCVDTMIRLYHDKNRSSYIHDHAGGRLLVVEAGGVVSDQNDKELDFSCGRKLLNNYGFVASANGELHQIVLDAISKTEAKETKTE